MKSNGGMKSNKKEVRTHEVEFAELERFFIHTHSKLKLEQKLKVERNHFLTLKTLSGTDLNSNALKLEQT